VRVKMISRTTAAPSRQRGGVGESGLAEPGDGVHEGDHAAGAEHPAGNAEPPLVGVRGDERAAAQEHEQADGNVDEEHPPPAEGVREDAAEQ
jgi:hypothetical protein